MTHLLEYETIKTSTIIQYPHAVSYFCELNLSYDYIAMTYLEEKRGTCTCKHCWKKKEPRIRSREALRLYWGIEETSISKIEAFSIGNNDF